MRYYRIALIEGKPDVSFMKINRIVYDGETAVVSTNEELERFESELTQAEWESFLAERIPSKTDEPEMRKPEPQEAATDAIIAGIAEMYAQQTQVMNTLMAGMADLYVQIEALKNGGTV
ncbi:hypothetical protein ACH33_08760 [Aneurinibacillus sp. XH2]|uniref:hypothetical protein n=1 Tax=Aneurinibacillus sp. XH2 TaxID=1450761 RepID=UPI00070D2355|nr:hypothetical protein [Aneurinibacillus sp. XH2]AMA72941.1 hypothetical protein ACH33_08760 [Aneurinibacillus sp. XH2]